MATIVERLKCPKCGSDYLEWEGEIYSPFWVDEFKEECPDCGYFRQSILSYGLTQQELDCMHFSHLNVGTMRSGMIKKPQNLQGKFVFMGLHTWSLPDLEIQWYKPEEISTDFRRVPASGAMSREEHELRLSAMKEIRDHAKYYKEVRKLTHEDLAEITRRGVQITDDPTADLLAYEAQKEEREKTEQTVSVKSDSIDESDPDPGLSESPTIPKGLLDQAVQLARKIAGAR